MDQIDRWARIAKTDFGFEEAGRLNRKALKFSSKVREMCSANRCNMYGASWSCPPACGTLEQIIKETSAFTEGFLVQSVGILEDEFDIEQMMETEKLHKERFYRLVERCVQSGEAFYAMSAGACTLCEKCTYPNQPCRFPQKVFPSMEACGLVVSDVCRNSGMKYNYGKLTFCYTSCILKKNI